jgi:glycosyltransferase involved in cell wall biosynthesis
MISIIVIGHNEGKRLTKCLSSISILIARNKNQEFEVNYIDSNSIDDSIERVKAFPDIKIYELTGKMNAAIARNVGAQESTGDILFFVDGDMELEPDFLQYALNDYGSLKHDSLTGHVDDYFYNTDGIFITSSPRTYSGKIPATTENLKTNGGIFLIKRAEWFNISGMRTKYKVNEDVDFTIRLGNRGIVIKRIPYLITKHHTIDYRDENRMWKIFFSGYGLYPGVIFRDHFFNMTVFKKTVRSHYTPLLLLIILIFSIISITSIDLMIVIYLFVLALRSLLHAQKIRSNRNKIIYFFERFFLQFLLDMSFWVGALLFYPGIKRLEYKSLTS